MKHTMKNIMVVGFLSLGTIPLLAHGGIEHAQQTVKEQSSEKQIVEASKKHIEKLIQNNKIDSNWKNNTLIKVKQQKLNDGLEWVVQYQNTQVKDPTKQTLFIFVDLYGKVKAANHTGK